MGSLLLLRGPLVSMLLAIVEIQGGGRGRRRGRRRGRGRGGGGVGGGG